MLKPNEWGNNYYNKWMECAYLNLGDTIMKAGKFGYWSLTQFTFICEEQYKKWHNFNDRLKNRWNVGIEQYFLDKTGKYVNYKEMVRFCDEKIREGVMDPADVFNKHRHDNRFERPHFIIDRAAALIRVKELIRDKQFPVREDADEYEEAEEYVD